MLHNKMAVLHSKALCTRVRSAGMCGRIAELHTGKAAKRVSYANRTLCGWRIRSSGSSARLSFCRRA
jgi:hypothetical protein